MPETAIFCRAGFDYVWKNEALQLSHAVARNLKAIHQGGNVTLSEKLSSHDDTKQDRWAA